MKTLLIISTLLLFTVGYSQPKKDDLGVFVGTAGAGLSVSLNFK